MIVLRAHVYVSGTFVSYTFAHTENVQVLRKINIEGMGAVLQEKEDAPRKLQWIGVGRDGDCTHTQGAIHSVHTLWKGKGSSTPGLALLLRVEILIMVPATLSYIAHAHRTVLCYSGGD